MNRFKVLAMIFCLAWVALAFPPGVKADGQSKRTVVTFNEPVEIPGGTILPPGTYVFKLMDSASDRNIIQIFNEEETRMHATVLAIVNYRSGPAGRTVTTFGETAAGSPEALRAWFYPGDNWGQEFVYPKTRAIELAKLTNQPVPSMPSELASNITVPATSVNDPHIVALKEAPLKAVRPTGEEVEITEIVEWLPIERTPEQTQPIRTTAVQTLPIETTTLQTAPLLLTVVQTLRIEIIAVQTRDLETTVVQTAPIQTTAVQTLPI